VKNRTGIKLTFDLKCPQCGYKSKLPAEKIPPDGATCPVCYFAPLMAQGVEKKP